MNLWRPVVSKSSFSGFQDTQIPPETTRQTSWQKKGADKTQPQTKATYRTAKQMIRANIKEEWLSGWSTNETGRELYKYMAAPKRADPINDLNRKDQSTIFRLRIQHVGLNKHLYRIGAHTTSACPLCDNPEETVNHHLFFCAPLADLRTQFLPPQPDKEQLLYGTSKQPMKTCKFHYMALGRRAKVITAAG